MSVNVDVVHIFLTLFYPPFQCINAHTLVSWVTPHMFHSCDLCKVRLA